MATTGERFERAVSIMARLRGPGGCPWDREQTFDTIKPYTLEEAYEVVEAIDARDWDELTGELGDLLLQVLFYSEMAAEEKRFSIDDVLDRLSDKLIDRHPHVFGDVKADTPADVLRNWQALKAEEKKKRQPESGENGKKQDHPESVLAGVSSAMPSLMEAYKISSRVANVGFDWPEYRRSLREAERRNARASQESRRVSRAQVRVRSRLPAWRVRAGSRFLRNCARDWKMRSATFLFVLVNIARYLSLDPESALRKTNRKFRRRFEYLEERLREQGRKPSGASLDEMESLWQESKRQEKA